MYGLLKASTSNLVYLLCTSIMILCISACTTAYVYNKSGLGSTWSVSGNWSFINQSEQKIFRGNYSYSRNFSSVNLKLSGGVFSHTETQEIPWHGSKRVQRIFREEFGIKMSLKDLDAIFQGEGDRITHLKVTYSWVTDQQVTDTNHILNKLRYIQIESGNNRIRFSINSSKLN